MGQDESTQVSRVRTHVPRVRTHVLAMNLNISSLDTSDIQPYIPTN